jgi:hypothetical protein
MRSASKDFSSAYGREATIVQILISLRSNFRKQPKADLHGMTRPVSFAVEHVVHDANLCGGYRRGFSGTTSFALKEYRIDYDSKAASLKRHHLP